MILTNALVVPMTERRKSFRGHVRVKQGVIAEVNEGSLQPSPMTKKSWTAPAAF
jgi:hypothetical protein